MTMLETRVSDALTAFSGPGVDERIVVAGGTDAPILACPLAIAAAFAGGAVYGGGLVAAFEAGRAVRGG